jgi:hypothetical protein
MIKEGSLVLIYCGGISVMSILLWNIFKHIYDKGIYNFSIFVPLFFSTICIIILYVIVYYSFKFK